MHTPQLIDQDDVYLIGGDSATVTKSGTRTFGPDRFFSSLYGKPVKGIALFVLSLISVKHGISHPVITEQEIKPEKEKASESSGRSKQKKSNKSNKKSEKKRSRGRPAGSRNKNRRDVGLPPCLLRIQDMLRQLLSLTGNKIKPCCCVSDGAFGNNNAVRMVRQCGIHLISKLRNDSSLCFPYNGPYSGRGPRRKYGKKPRYDSIPDKYLKNTTIVDNIRTCIYQMTMWHRLFADQLNIVIIVKTNPKTQTRDHVVLFTSDPDLSYDKIIEYYRLRFQTEFSFRDARQHRGPEDFMNINRIPVTNAANLAMFMVNVSQALIRDIRKIIPYFGVNDLKAHYRALKYVKETLKLLPQKPDPILIDKINDHVSLLGSVNANSQMHN